MFWTRIVERIETHFVFNIFFNRALLWDNVGKYCRVGRATDDNMAHAHCMTDA